MMMMYRRQRFVASAALSIVLVWMAAAPDIWSSLSPTGSARIISFPKPSASTAAAAAALSSSDNSRHHLHNDSMAQTAQDRRHDEALRKIVWLLSFPNSGTSYTKLLVKNASGLSVGTNYAKEYETREQGKMAISIFQHSHNNNRTDDGPFIEGQVVGSRYGKPLRPMPEYILTKNHCGGRCSKCDWKRYHVSLDEFIDACQKIPHWWKGSDKDGGSLQKMEATRMSLEKVAKVFWLMRHPMENIVSRYHLELHRWQRNETDPDIPRVFHKHFLGANKTVGFRAWCSYLDKKFDTNNRNWLESKLPVQWSLWERVPCRGEFFKYAQWHNRVGQMVKGPNAILGDRPLMHWYYENYAVDESSSSLSTANVLPVDRILAFLDQKRKHGIPPFRMPTPIYRTTHFTSKERIRIWALLEASSTNLTWDLLLPYRKEHHVENLADDEAASSKSQVVD